MRRVCESAPCLAGNAGIGTYQSQTQYLEKNFEFCGEETKRRQIGDMYPHRIHFVSSCQSC